MKYSCEVIRDLLPLYIDDVCSEESKKIVDGHVEECGECRAYFEKMLSTADIPQPDNKDENDAKMAESLKKVKRTIFLKRIMAAVLAAAVVVAVFIGVSFKMQNTAVVIEYEDNITVGRFVPEQFKSVQGQDYLSAQITGRNIMSATQKRVDIQKNGDVETIIYFYTFTTQWEDRISKENTISYHLISPLNEDNDIDKVYYYTGTYHELEMMTEENLEKVNENAVLLWSKGDL